MKKGVVGCLVLALSLAGLGVATDDQIAVAAYLVRRITLAPDYIDCWEGLECANVEVTYPTYESLFERTVPPGNPGADWTPAQRRNAFEAFLMDVPRLAQTNTVENLGYLTETAFRYSDNRGATNVFECAKNILSTPCTVGEACAYSVFTEKVVPSEEMNAFVELAITNRPTSTYAEGIAGDYVGKIHKSLGTLDGAVVTNGTRMLLRVRQGDYSAVQLDKLLLDVYPEYASSSNRLELSERTLRTLVDDTIFCDKSIRPYFDAVTNQLHGATQPLPEVEALRGL